MINVNQITSQLARMPDQALQQYAALHKGDPYTVALALSESNRRKQMRTASQMPQGEQPKVVDQDIAAMAAPAPQAAQTMPEDVGIGQLPAGNMDFAEGGIVAFADGGPTAAMQGGASVPFGGYGGGPSMFPAQTGYEGMGIMEFLRAFGADVLAKLPSEEKERLKANEARKAQGFEAERERNMAQLTAASGSPTDPDFRRQPDPRIAGMLPDAAPAAGLAGAQSSPGAGTGRAAPPAGGEGITRLLAPRATRAAPAAGGDFLSQFQATQNRLGPAEDKLRAERQANIDADVKDRREGIAKLETDQAEELTGMFKGKEERLSKREAELGKEKGKAEGLALLEAGLAMMQSKGRGLAGIAQGAGVGLKAYSAGIDKIKSGQEKIDEARDRMEELRQNQVSMNKRDIRAEERGIRDTLSAGRREITTGAEQAGVKQQAIALAATTSDIAGQRAREQQASAERIAGENRAASAERLGGAGGKLDVKKIEVELKSLTDELGKLSSLKKDDARRAVLQEGIDSLRRQLRDGTIAPPSAAAAPGGTLRMRFDAQGNPIK